MSVTSATTTRSNSSSVRGVSNVDLAASADWETLETPIPMGNTATVNTKVGGNAGMLNSSVNTYNGTRANDAVAPENANRGDVSENEHGKENEPSNVTRKSAIDTSVKDFNAETKQVEVKSRATYNIERKAEGEMKEDGEREVDGFDVKETAKASAAMYVSTQPFNSEASASDLAAEFELHAQKSQSRQTLHALSANRRREQKHIDEQQYDEATLNLYNTESPLGEDTDYSKDSRKPERSNLCTASSDKGFSRNYMSQSRQKSDEHKIDQGHTAIEIAAEAPKNPVEDTVQTVPAKEPLSRSSAMPEISNLSSASSIKPSSKCLPTKSRESTQKELIDQQKERSNVSYSFNKRSSTSSASNRNHSTHREILDGQKAPSNISDEPLEDRSANQARIESPVHVNSETSPGNALLGESQDGEDVPYEGSVKDFIVTAQVETAIEDRPSETSTAGNGTDAMARDNSEASTSSGVSNKFKKGKELAPFVSVASKSKAHIGVQKRHPASRVVKQTTKQSGGRRDAAVTRAQYKKRPEEVHTLQEPDDSEDGNFEVGKQRLHHRPEAGYDNGVQQKALLELMIKGLGNFTTNMADVVIGKLRPEYEGFAKQVGREVKEETTSELKELREKVTATEKMLKKLGIEKETMKYEMDKEREEMKKEIERDKLRRLRELETKTETIASLEDELKKTQTQLKEKEKITRKADHKAKYEEHKRVKLEEDYQGKLKELQTQLNKAKSDLLVMKSKRRLQKAGGQHVVDTSGKTYTKLISHHGMYPRHMSHPKHVPYDEGDD